jgi:hypothetical protein
MENAKIYNTRTSDLFLHKMFNPTNDNNLAKIPRGHLAEACGIIPDYFCEACLADGPLKLDDIAAGMDNLYQCGGFAYPLDGTVDENGIYQSKYDDDPALPPLGRFIFGVSRDKGFECFVYEYGITAIRDLATRDTKVARFD